MSTLMHDYWLITTMHHVRAGPLQIHNRHSRERTANDCEFLKLQLCIADWHYAKCSNSEARRNVRQLQKILEPGLITYDTIEVRYVVHLGVRVVQRTARIGSWQFSMYEVQHYDMKQITEPRHRTFDMYASAVIAFMHLYYMTLTYDLENLFSKCHLRDEYLWQVSLKSVH